jgi:hypothetical protein
VEQPEQWKWSSFRAYSYGSGVSEMSLGTAFFIAIITGVVSGAAAGRLRKMMLRADEFPFPAALYGGIGAAIIFGTAVAFDRRKSLISKDRDQGGSQSPHVVLFKRKLAIRTVRSTQDLQT